MKKIGRHTPNSCPTTWGAIVRSGNCLVVFHNPFFPFQPLFKLTKISLKFMCTPALIKLCNENRTCIYVALYEHSKKFVYVEASVFICMSALI